MLKHVDEVMDFDHTCLLFIELLHFCNQVREAQAVS